MNAIIQRIDEARAMTEDAFERERQRIRETYGDSSVEASALRDQALAALFYRSGWTQQRLAEKEGIVQQRVTQRLLFGRYLAITTTGSNPRNLTERRFRGYWARTTGTNERQRFAAVAQLIEQELRVGMNTAPRPDISKPLVQKFADGDWHRLETMVKHIEQPAERVEAVLNTMRVKGTHGCNCERKQVGKEFRYRIVKGAGKRIDVALLMEELGPVIVGLKAEGKKNAATFSPSRITALVHQLEQLLAKLSK